MKNICKRTLCAALALGMALLPAGATNWGLWYGNGLHQPPNGEDTVQTLAKYGAYYMGSADEKTLYLTFDCGYENGNTAKYWIPSRNSTFPARSSSWAITSRPLRHLSGAWATRVISSATIRTIIPT